MAWLKVEFGTPEKPALLLVQDLCNASEGDAFLAWFRLWRWFDEATEDGFVATATRGGCDRVARLPGISAALERAGWLEFPETGGVVVVGWEKHNGCSAKRRLLVARRNGELRARGARRESA